ncbi:hypothetical protein FAES_1928 [Fibrella aestuarina BUZ 2]|uniref:Uncharacterized protein n=1 Tax=Fibrella aestuarina BUZ 2 TaxID=1166018 RepID=I0K734_9BACT|nr:hypothetical protein [Fibrella aestuarina]CCG99937.1 hypothetical protein FAES_1928 [Fibrella aestuarina BUZ 2]
MRPDIIAEQIGRLRSDVRLEVVLAELFYDGVNPMRELLIHPAGLFERSFRHDIGRATVGNPDVWGTGPASIDPSRPQYINIEVHRDGIYDYLPEGLFHQPSNLGRDQAEVFDDIDEQARRQRGMRQFFQPIEQEFYLQGLAMELEERKYLINEQTLRQNDQGAVLRQFWGLPPDLLDLRQLNNLLHLLPIAHRLVHNTELVSQVFTLILGVPVAIRTIPPLLHLITLSENETPAPSELSKAELGSFALEGVYQDTMPAYEISIGPLHPTRLNEFLEIHFDGKVIFVGDSRKIVNLLIEYFMPYETDVVVNLKIRDELSTPFSVPTHAGRLSKNPQVKRTFTVKTPQSELDSTLSVLGSTTYI